MFEKCKKAGSLGGLYIKTFSGASEENIVCNLDSSAELCHVVCYVNLNTYPVTVTCSASVADHGYIQFNSPYSSDTNSIWRDQFTLYDKGEKVQSHVKLRNRNIASGEETVDTTVIADWGIWRPRDTKTLSFNLKVKK
jgi:hypothetical protein